MAGPTRPWHAILGGGPVADVLLWRKWTVSAAFLGGAVVIWFLFQFVNYTFVTLLCKVGILTMLVLCFWSIGALFFNWSPPNIVHHLTVPECTFRCFFTNFNRLLLSFYEISTGKNFTHFTAVIGSLGILSVIGQYINFLNLSFLVLLSSLIVPAILEWRENRESGFSTT